MDTCRVNVICEAVCRSYCRIIDIIVSCAVLITCLDNMYVCLYVSTCLYLFVFLFVCIYVCYLCFILPLESKSSNLLSYLDLKMGANKEPFNFMIQETFYEKWKSMQCANISNVRSDVCFHCQTIVQISHKTLIKP